MNINLDLSLLNMARGKMGAPLVDESLDYTPLPKPDPIAMTRTKKAEATTHQASGLSEKVSKDDDS